ncbi:MAG: hypothetical protein ACOYLQ_03520 [Hyphomicrobiaceae bacterium]
MALDSGLLDEVQRVGLAPTAKLFADTGFPDSVKGVSNPSDRDYRVRLKLVDQTLRFDIVDPRGEAGQIIVALPRRMKRFEVDPRLAAPEPNHGPVLYKEWRLTGTAKLGGIFAGRGRAQQARLVFHGQGNRCTTASDFMHWTLVVTGPDAKFSLLGEVARDAPARQRQAPAKRKPGSKGPRFRMSGRGTVRSGKRNLRREDEPLVA